MTATRLRIAAIVLGALLVYACGAAAPQSYAQSRTAAQIVDDASTALRSVTSAHVTIASTYQGAPGQFEGNIQSGNVDGSMTIGPNTMKMIVVGGTLYLYGPDLLAFTHVTDPTVSSRVGQQWIAMPIGLIVDPQSLQAFGDVGGRAACVKSGTGYTKKGTTTIRGASVVEVDDSAGTKVFVKTAAPHYPLRIAYAGSDQQCSGSSQGQPGTIDLSQIGAHYEITVPPNATDLASTGLSPGG